MCHVFELPGADEWAVSNENSLPKEWTPDYIHEYMLLMELVKGRLSHLCDIYLTLEVSCMRGSCRHRGNRLNYFGFMKSLPLSSNLCHNCWFITSLMKWAPIACNASFYYISAQAAHTIMGTIINLRNWNLGGKKKMKVGQDWWKVWIMFTNLDSDSPPVCSYMCYITSWRGYNWECFKVWFLAKC